MDAPLSVKRLLEQIKAKIELIEGLRLAISELNTEQGKLSQQGFKGTWGGMGSLSDEDKKKKEAVEARNMLDSAVYQAEKMKSENKDKLSEDDIKKIDEAVEKAKKVVADTAADKDGLESAAKELNEVLMPIGAKMYENTASAETPAGEDAKKEDGPIEGEVVDDKKEK